MKMYINVRKCTRIYMNIYTQKKKSYQQLEIWGQIAPQLYIIKL